jgi:hypothetical protein
MKDPTPMINHMREAETRGWQIEAATDFACVGRCPTVGCSMRVKLSLGASIPARVVNGFRNEHLITCFKDAADLLIDRRQDLKLTALEVANAAGVTDFLIAKGETKDPKRGTGFETVLLWANSLGYDIVFRPARMPPVTLRAVAETRDRVNQRGKVNDINRRRSPQDRQV